MELIKYYISPESITFYKDKKIEYVSAENTLVYECLKESLKDGTEIVAQNTKDILKSAIKRKSSLLGINDRIERLEKENMPVQPLLSFIDKVPEKVLEKNPNLVHLVGTPDIPLTWEGDVVLYQRASWVKQEGLTRWVNEDTFEPFKEYKSSQAMLTGSFNWVMKRCPDTGLAFEVIVKAEDIVSSGAEGQIYVKALTHLSALGFNVKTEQKSETSIVEYMTSCSEMGDIAVRLPYNAGTASKLLSSMFESSFNKEAVNNIVPARVGAALASC